MPEVPEEVERVRRLLERARRLVAPVPPRPGELREERRALGRRHRGDARAHLGERPVAVRIEERREDLRLAVADRSRGA